MAKKKVGEKKTKGLTSSRSPPLFGMAAYLRDIPRASQLLEDLEVPYEDAVLGRADSPDVEPQVSSPVPAAAGPATKSGMRVILPNLDSSSPELIGIPIDEDSPTEGASVRIKQHTLYPNKLVALQVEDTVYHLSAKTLRASTSFVQLLGKREEHDSAPIKLKHVTVFEMDCMLRILEARLLYDDPVKFDLTELTAILKLSTGWKFDAAREFAIKELAKMKQPSLKRLELAHNYRVKDWLEPAYYELCSRTRTWTAQEHDQLFDIIGIAGLYTLMTLREDYVRNSYQHQEIRPTPMAPLGFAWNRADKGFSELKKGGSEMGRGSDEAVYNGYNTTGTTVQCGTPSTAVINRIKTAIASSATLALKDNN